MFYRPEDGHGLPHNPFNAIVTPRPIGWIATRGADGPRTWHPTRSSTRSPTSPHRSCSPRPPPSRTARARRTASRTSAKPGLLRQHCRIRDAGRDEPHFPLAAGSRRIRDGGDRARGVPDNPLLPRRQRPCEPRMPCGADRAASGEANFVVFGEVTGVHLRDDCLKDGVFDVLAFNPLTAWATAITASSARSSASSVLASDPLSISPQPRHARPAHA